MERFKWYKQAIILIKSDRKIAIENLAILQSRILAF